MSIAMDWIEPSGLGGGGGGVPCGSMFEKAPIAGREAGTEEEQRWCSSSSTSSIGKNSDLSRRSSSEGEDGDEIEVQSAYNGPLDMMNSLEQVLPIRRGISNFYNGKSKSFTSLADASSTSSIKDIAKQENAYSRRRRNLIAINHRGSGCGISKKTISTSRSTLALAVAMSSSESISSTSDESNSRSPPPLPPLHPRSKASSRRSFSVADLQQCRTEASLNPNPYPSFGSDKTEHKH